MAERPSASGQKEVGRGCCAEAKGLLATPGDLTSRQKRLPKRWKDMVLLWEAVWKLSRAFF